MKTGALASGPVGGSSGVDVRVKRARLNYIKERLKDLRAERESLVTERDTLKSELDIPEPKKA